MSDFFKFKLGLMICLGTLLTTDAAGSPSLSPYARPYLPRGNDRNISMIRIIRNGLTTYVPQKTLLMLEELNSQEIEGYTWDIQENFFWAAVYNSYHGAAFKLAEALFAELFPEPARIFPILSTFSESEKLIILSRFYSFLARVQNDQFSHADRACFTRHAANFRPQ